MDTLECVSTASMASYGFKFKCFEGVALECSSLVITEQ
jgi:hypothetical protein